YSMEQVYYDIPAGTPVGSYSLTLDQNSLATDPGADFVNLISNSNTVAYFSPGTAINGAIVVNAAVIPEPASVVLMVLGSIGLIGFGLRRARRA
ncbi:MAG TPA: PEP-CTERM sorting domain-containing protein, partial [Pirellulales bacterium]|nr:PEP-CTERM sorting domain-containing protein [Pirellulales bacterium]